MKVLTRKGIADDPELLDALSDWMNCRYQEEFRIAYQISKKVVCKGKPATVLDAYCCLDDIDNPHLVRYEVRYEDGTKESAVLLSDLADYTPPPAPRLPPKLLPNYLIDGEVTFKSFPKVSLGPDELAGRAVRVTDASRLSKNVFMCEGVIEAVFSSGNRREFRVHVPGHGHFQLKDSEVRLL